MKRPNEIRSVLVAWGEGRGQVDAHSIESNVYIVFPDEMSGRPSRKLGSRAKSDTPARHA